MTSNQTMYHLFLSSCSASVRLAVMGALALVCACGDVSDPEDMDDMRPFDVDAAPVGDDVPPPVGDDVGDDVDGDGFAANVDCDDDDPTIHPGAIERCDDIDRDCDGSTKNGLLGLSESCPALDCVELAESGVESGVFTIDPDADGLAEPYEVYCNNAIAGGGWQLISSRHVDVGSLFDVGNLCVEPQENCSGTIPLSQVYEQDTPDLLFATVDDTTWMQLAGLLPFGRDGLLDIITGYRPLTASDSCEYPHQCGQSTDVALHVDAHSDNFQPRDLTLEYQWSRHGGLWFSNGGGGGPDHVLSMNYWAYCDTPGGLHMSSNEDSTLGNVVCGAPGAVYFRYPR